LRTFASRRNEATFSLLKNTLHATLVVILSPPPLSTLISLKWTAENVPPPIFPWVLSKEGGMTEKKLGEKEEKY
jgi:hypothetical protein